MVGIIQSALKETIKALPDNFAMKAESIAPALLKKGVKPEELEYADMALPTGKVTKEQLVKAEGKRKDFFSVKKLDSKDYDGASLDLGNPTYAEKVLQYKRIDGQTIDAGDGYVSPHFPETPDYLMHTRIFDIDHEGTPSRVLQEIQSDLHQDGRQRGYKPDGELDLATDTLDLPPKSPLEKNWLRKGIERELVDAANEGRSQLMIPISGAVENLHRSEGVQKWYETTVLDTAKKIAKQTNSDFSVVTKRTGTGEEEIADKFYDMYEAMHNNDMASVETLARELGIPEGTDLTGVTNIEGLSRLMKLVTTEFGASVQYAVIKPKGPVSTTLYSTPVAGAFVAYSGLQAGMSQEDINAKFEAQGYDAEDIAEINSRTAVISQAVSAGMPLDEIKAKMEGREISADTVSAEPRDIRNEMIGKWSPEEGETKYASSVKKGWFASLTNDEPMTASELVSSLKVLYPTLTSDIATSIPAYFGSQEAKQRYDVARESSRARIIEIAKKDYGTDLMWAPEGVGDEGWYAQTDNGMVEVTPGFLQDLAKSRGEIIGGIGAAISGGILGAKAAPNNPLAKVAGVALGGLLGALGGSNVDYLSEAIEMNADMEFQAAAYRSFNAIEAAAIGEIIGYPVAKGAGALWKQIATVKDNLVPGQANAAYRALKDATFLSDDQIEEIVASISKHVTLKGSKKQQGIQAVVLTQPDMQSLLGAASGTRARAGSVVASQLSQRSEQVIRKVGELADNQTPKVLTEDLMNYTRDVKDNYSAVKALATQSPNAQNFSFDIEELAIQPVLDDLFAKIVDPSTKEKFVNQMSRVNQMSESRTFGDLLELRQMTNDFLYNSRIVKADDKATIRSVLNNIDLAIAEGAPSVVSNPDKWLADWADARVQYTAMKKVEKSAIYKSVFNKDGSVRAVTPEQVTNSLAKYITALDGGFEEVVSKLPVKGRSMYEGAVVNTLANKFTTGTDKGVRIVNFPLLANELNKVTLTTPDARAAKKALVELGEVFKNDPYLAAASGKFSLPQFQSYLTTDPTTRLKFEVASGVFNTVKSYAPTEEARRIALVKQTAKLMSNPLDYTSFNDLTKAVYPDVNLTNQLKELQQEAAKAKALGRDQEVASIKVYSGGKLKGTGASTSVPMHRVATLAQVKDIMDSEGLTVHSKALDTVLQKYGYKAIMQGSDRVRLLGDK